MVPESFTRDGYVSHMKSMARWAARRFSRLHPLFSSKDLEQEAVIPLLTIYDEKHQEKPPIELCRLGRIAVLRHLRGLHRHAFNYGEFTTPIMDLDMPFDQEGHSLSDLLGSPGLEDVFFWFALDELERLLGDLERKVLTELLAPNDRTLQAVRDAYAARPFNKSGNKRQGNYEQKDRLNSLSSSLGIPVTHVRFALNNIQRLTLQIFGNDFSVRPYKVVSQAKAPRPPHTSHKGDSRMEPNGSKGVIPDDFDPMNATEEVPVAPKSTPKSTPKSATKSAAEKQKEAKAKKAKTSPAKGKAALKPSPKGKTPKVAKASKDETTKGPRKPRAVRNIDPSKPFREGCNADVAWKYLVSVISKSKDKTVTAEDAAKGFEKVGKKDQDAAKAGSYFLYWLAKHGLLTRTERGAYTLPKK